MHKYLVHLERREFILRAPHPSKVHCGSPGKQDDCICLMIRSKSF